MKRMIFFGFFQKNIEKCRKKWKMMKMGQILMRKVKVDEKWKNDIFWIFFWNNLKKLFFSFFINFDVFHQYLTHFYHFSLSSTFFHIYLKKSKNIIFFIFHQLWPFSSISEPFLSFSTFFWHFSIFCWKNPNFFFFIFHQLWHF